MSDLTSASPESYGEAAGAGANIAFPHEPSARYATTIGLTVRPEDAHAAHNAFSWLAAKASAEWVQLLAADLFRRIRARPAGRAGPASGRRRPAQGFLQNYQRLLGCELMLASSISKTTMRRYVLGRQGLWPGRRVADKPGVAQIIRQIGAVQIDPINVVARSHDIVLWGRVAGYQPSQLDELLYSNRQFFDYGGGLEVYPIEELPYWI